jgi:sugar phosphate isomerase/epimerase
MKQQPLAHLDRRRFLQSGLAAGLGLPLFGCRALAGKQATKGPLFTKFGINAPLDQAAAVAKQGADFLLIGVNNFLKPNEPLAEFEKELRKMEQSPIPVLSCNSFLRGDALRSVGPNAKTEDVLTFAGTAFKRAKRAGVERIIFGSSGSRRLPEGWSKAQADKQFISLLKKMGDLAGAEGVVVAVENLQQRECNYLTRIHEVGEIVTEVNHPHIRLLADIYHSSCMQDPPEDFQKYAHLIEMVEIAEAKGRTVPGVNGQDFRPYFNALRQGGYQGPIEIEGKWEVDQISKAYATIREQSAG